MEKYNLEQTGQQVQNILNEATTQSELTAETERAQLAEQQLQNDIDAIEEKIPSGASSSNKLTTKEYVDDSVSTATATFRGTFNLVSDLGLTVDATEQQIAAALASEISTADNNDYCFVQIPTSDETPTEIEEIDRYKFNGTAWSFEYKLNNSGFTADQWNAINSHITSGDVAKLLALPTNAELTILLNGKQNVLTFDNVPTENSNNPVKSGGVKSAIDDEKGARINSDTALQQAIDGINGKIPSDASSENKLATISDVDDEATARSNADQSLQDAIEAILLLIPTAASSLNQLADKAFVNSSIATNTATFRGTFNLVNDLHLTLAATHAQVGNALALAILESDNNDYAFVQIPTVETAPNEIAQTDRYKFNGSTWEYEYTLNNSGFTSAQWIAINSGITSVLVSKLSALPTNSELTSEFGALTTAINDINLKIPAAAAQNNKLVDTAALEAYIIQVLDVLTVSYDVTSSDGHITFHIEQTDGKITAVTLTTNDIASANDLTVLAGRVTTAENDIDSLEFRVGTNEADIALLQAAYSGLTQSDIIVGALPASGVANKIYRVPGTNSYSDYMWNGTQFVLMATYNNAIDPRPKKDSTNLVESGGVFDNMGALDISELNATENPHTLATYADLSAALAAIPSNDYKKGGMSVKYVSSSDHKYVQYQLMSESWSTNVADWQKNVSISPNTLSVRCISVNDGNDNNIPDLASILSPISYSTIINTTIDNSTGELILSAGRTLYYIPVVSGKSYLISASHESVKNFRYGFCSSTPKRGVYATNYQSLQLQNVSILYNATSDGYLVVSKVTEYYQNFGFYNTEWTKWDIDYKTIYATQTSYIMPIVHIGSLRIILGGKSMVYTINDDFSVGASQLLLLDLLTKECRVVNRDVAPSVVDVVLIGTNANGYPCTGYLYSDYISRLYLIVNVTTNASTTYSLPNVHIGNIYTYTIEGYSQQSVINDDFTLPNYSKLILNLNNNSCRVETSQGTELSVNEIILLSVNTSGEIVGGVLYNDYINKSKINPLAGKKIVATGSSTTYGSTITNPYENSFVAKCAKKLGMSYVNYAIGGSCFSKGSADDYEEVFYSLEDFQVATKDTTKKYLVKDGQIGDARPWHIYHYEDNDWTIIGTSSTDNGRTPIVDTIDELDADADIVIIGSLGGNDWAYRGDNYGVEYLYDGPAAGANPEVAKLTFCGSLHLMCRNLMTKYQGKLVIFTSFGGTFRYQRDSSIPFACITPNQENLYGYTSSQYSETVEIIIQQYGFDLLRVSQKLGFTPYNYQWWCGDPYPNLIRVHPNGNAHIMGGDILASYLLNYYQVGK